MTAPDVNADVRARFEAWARSRGICVMKKADREYVESYTRHVWDAYRAAHADLSGEVRELVEAARYAMNNIHMVDGTAMDAVVGPTFTVYGMFLNKLHAALAKFHPTQSAGDSK